MSLLLYRVDDRLIHGQVVVGWGQPLEIKFIVLVDDDVATSDWEQELYRMGVPPELEVFFSSVNDAPALLPAFVADPRPGLLLTGSIGSMARLVSASEGIKAVNLGGVHHAEGRTQRLRYVFLTPAEESELRELQQHGVVVTAQDVPSARPVTLDELLAAGQDA